MANDRTATFNRPVTGRLVIELETGVVLRDPITPEILASFNLVDRAEAVVAQFEKSGWAGFTQRGRAG